MSAFRALDIAPDDGLFDALLAGLRLEAAGKGRLGAVLARVDEDGAPLVRTTARFAAPSRPWRAVDERLAQRVQALAALATPFNNALFERYSDACTTMGSHSDLALDLAEGSSIALCSCYQRPVGESPPRRLVVEPKCPGDEGFSVPLTHGGVVVFSLATNARYRHKIVLAPSAKEPENPWVGVTFRTAKTRVRYRDGGAFFTDGEALSLADDAQRQAFYRLRRRENQELDFAYPPLRYTVSEGDLLPPAP